MKQLLYFVENISNSTKIFKNRRRKPSAPKYFIRYLDKFIDKINDLKRKTELFTKIHFLCIHSEKKKILGVNSFLLTRLGYCMNESNGFRSVVFVSLSENSYHFFFLFKIIVGL